MIRMNLHNFGFVAILAGTPMVGVLSASPPVQAAVVDTVDVGDIRVEATSFKAGKYVYISFQVKNARVIEFACDYIVQANVTDDAYRIKTMNGMASWELKQGKNARVVGRITFPLTIRVPFDRQSFTISVRAIGASGKVVTRPTRTIYVEGAQIASERLSSASFSNGSTTIHGQPPIAVEFKSQGNQELGVTPTGATATYYSASLNMLLPLKPGISAKIGVQNAGTKDRSFHPNSSASNGETVNTVSAGIRVQDGRNMLDASLGWNLLPDWKSHMNGWQLQLGYSSSMWNNLSRAGGEITLTSNSFRDLGVNGSLDWWPPFMGTVPIGLSLSHVSKFDFTNGESDGLSGFALKARLSELERVNIEGQLGLMFKDPSLSSPTLQGGVSLRF